MSYPKVFRDPVHTNIELNRDSAPERLALALIDVPEVQRLRHVRQLALANQVYHGAEHSRFSHTLGVMHVAHKTYLAACTNSGIAPSEETLALLLASAVLHDVGHHPFSHAVEVELDIDHEDCTANLIAREGELRNLLTDFGGETFLDSVVAHITGESDAQTSKIISGQLDADRMDYVLRDGYQAGVPNSRYDHERILQLVAFDADGLVWDDRAQTAIESYFIARYHLYLQLYYHKTVRAAEVVLRAILRRAHALALAGTDLQVDATMHALVADRTWEASSQLSDNDVWQAIRIWSDHEDEILSDLSSRLRTRNLFKSIDLSVNDLGRLLETKEAAEDMARGRGLDPDYYVVVDEARDTPYKVVDASAGDDPQVSIRMRTSRDATYALETRSGMIGQLQQEAYQKVRLCLPDELRAEIMLGA